MTAGRFAAIAAHELRTQLRGPIFWMLLVMLLFVTSALNPVAMIPSGDTSVAGVRTFVNSPHALAQAFAIGSFFAYTFFAALMAGLAVIHDDEAGISELLRATPLTAAEYVFGKLTGVGAALGIAVCFHVSVALTLYEGAALVGAPATSHGPFRLGAYLAAAGLFALPGIAFTAALAFTAGERTRRPMAVYAVPIALFVYTLTVSWNFKPAGLEAGLDRVLMIFDPTSIRWLDRTLFRVDRGAAYYNTAPLTFDAVFLLNRIAALGVAGLAVLTSLRHYRRRGGRWRRMRDERARPGVRRSSATSAATFSGNRDVPAGESASFRPLRDLAMTSRPPRLLSGTATILRAELAEWWRRPALFLFAAFLMLVVVEVAGTEADVFGASALLTAGGLAVRAIPAVTILVCLFLLFAVVETMHRDRVTGFEPIFHAAPVSDGAILMGRALASGAIIAVLSAACCAAGLLMQLVQAEGRVEVWPLVLVFGLVLGPTFVLWTAFVGALMAIVRSRAAALALGLSALVATGAVFLSGSMTWVSNWPLWGALRWTDMGTFPLNGNALWWNRLAALAGAAFFFTISRVFLARTEGDAAATVARLRPARIARGALRVAPFALAFFLVNGFLAIEIREGPQGAPAGERAREYWRQNVATWRDAIPPEITRIDVKLDLEPSARRTIVQGTYELVNATDAPLLWLPFTIGAHFEPVAWSVAGVPVVAKDHAGLQILTPDPPLAPGASVRVGFSYAATVPPGVTRNGGGMGTFVLPAGVLLSTHRDPFLPVPGFVDSAGPELAARPAPARFPDGSVPKLAGAAARRKPSFRVRVEASAPSAYTVTSVGVKTAEWTEAGRTHVVWESDHPVGAFNVMAGRWEVRRRNDNAVFFHPGHEAAVDSILETLDSARRRYSEWFYPYPWKELRVCEFPDLETNATSLPTNISFSEGIGFLAGGDPHSGLAFGVTAHEVAHQWWGHLLSAGDGPGADVLIEGMANYSALLLHESENGPAARIEFAKQLERVYLERRRVDSERPLLHIVEHTGSDEATISMRGAWVLWMLHNELGRDRMLAGLRELIRRHVDSRLEATAQDLIAALRAQAPEPSVFDEFVAQWFAGSVLPEYQLSDTTVERTAAGWRVGATLRNVGTGAARIEIAALGFPQGRAEGDAAGRRRDLRALRLEPGRAIALEWTLDFRPERLVVDPEALVLQLNRDRAVLELPPA